MIVRDHRGIGKSPMFKQIKYEPVGTKSMRKRKTSQKMNDDFTRLYSSGKNSPSSTQKDKNLATQTVSPNITPLNLNNIDENSPKNSNGHRDMGCGANEDIIDEIHKMENNGNIVFGASNFNGNYQQ